MSSLCASVWSQYDSQTCDELTLFSLRDDFSMVLDDENHALLILTWCTIIQPLLTLVESHFRPLVQIFDRCRKSNNDRECGSSCKPNPSRIAHACRFLEFKAPLVCPPTSRSSKTSIKDLST